MTCALMGAVMLPIWYKAVKEVKVRLTLIKNDSYVGNQGFLVLPYHDV